MTQICPGRGVAPVPTWVSVICRPEAVVMVLPAAWAAACVDAPTANGPANVMATISEERRILLLLEQGLRMVERFAQPIRACPKPGGSVRALKEEMGVAKGSTHPT